jgi:hypothetical protein
LVLALLLAAAVVMIRVTAGPLREMAPYLDLVFMGAAFLLLETKNVVHFALLFGTTWMVNAAVFAGILLSVLAAVELARRVRLPRPWLLYVALLVALAVAWVTPQPSLLNLSLPVRFLAATVIAFAPIFLANRCSPSGSRTWDPRRWRSGRTCWARWPAGRSSTWRWCWVTGSC